MSNPEDNPFFGEVNVAPIKTIKTVSRQMQEDPDFAAAQLHARPVTDFIDEITPDPDLPTMIIDNREPMTTGIELVVSKGICNIEIKQLVVGDFMLRPAKNDKLMQDEFILIERKAASDFVQSHFNGRLNVQLCELAMYPHTMIVVIGSVHQGRFEDHTNINSLLASTALRSPTDSYAPRTIQVPTETDFGEVLIYCLTELLSKGRLYRDFALRDLTQYEKYKGRSLDNPYVMAAAKMGVLSTAPRVGRKTARLILEYFDWDLQAVIHATTATLQRIKGVGKVTATSIWKLFNDNGGCPNL